MAIYHFSAKVISRGKGQSAVASSAYRSGEKLKDERTGETKFYHREVKPDTMILAPEHAPNWVHDREKLWNEVEKIEKNHNSQLSREFEISLPKELSHEQQKELIKNYAQEQFVNRGMVADIAIHRDDENNPHAHVMCTMRSFKENGDWDNKKRKEYILNENGEKELDKKGKPKYKTYSITDWDQQENVSKWREQWSRYANKTMEREGIAERIDHRSNVDRGLETLPTQHLGHVANAMEKKGIATERGDYNREIEAYNEKIVELAKYREEKSQLQEQVKTKKFLKDDELVNIQKATKVINDKGKGFVSLETIDKRYAQLDNKVKRLEWQGENSNKQLEQFKKAGNYLSKVKDMEHKLSLQEQRLKDHSGFFKSFNKQNRIIKETTEQDIAFLKENINKFDKYLDHYRDKLGFSSREDFYNKQSDFLKERENDRNNRMNERAEIKHQREILKVAEKDLQRKEVREITSQYPELHHLGDTMEYQDALNLKAINEKMGAVVPIENIKRDLNFRTEKLNKAEQLLQQISNAEKQIERAETSFNRLEEVQAKIDKIDNSLIKQSFLSRDPDKQDYDRNVMKRDQLQKEVEKQGFTTREELNIFKEKITERMIPKRPQLEKNKQELEKGKSGFSLDELQKAVDSIERAELDHQRKHKEYENEKTRETEREIGG